MAASVCVNVERCRLKTSFSTANDDDNQTVCHLKPEIEILPENVADHSPTADSSTRRRDANVVVVTGSSMADSGHMTPRRRREQCVDYDADIVDGFMIVSFDTLDDLEVSDVVIVTFMLYSSF